jgi:predicted RNA binding protein YcfA (HicA-like mRNA interferase family)
MHERSSAGSFATVAHTYVGSHRLYEATDGRAKVLTSVAFHPGDIPTGTLRKIEKDMEALFGKGWLR